jgi:DDE superfamily endonuclease
VVGLYLHSPEKAVVVCVDEKPQIHARERTAPTLPVRPGRPEAAGFDYVRHGTTTLFAALEVAPAGSPTPAPTDTATRSSWPSLHQVARPYPRRQLHVVVDNLATHKHPAVRRLAGSPPADHPALQADLGLVAQPGRGVLLDSHPPGPAPRHLPTGADLIAAIQRFIDAWNDRCAPFIWTKDPDTVIAKATDPRHRKTQPTSDTEH